MMREYIYGPRSLLPLCLRIGRLCRAVGGRERCSNDACGRVWNPNRSHHSVNANGDAKFHPTSARGIAYDPSIPTAPSVPTVSPTPTPRMVTNAFPEGCRSYEREPDSSSLCIYTFATDPLPDGCGVDKVYGVVSGFLDAFNRGDGDAVAGFFMTEPSYGSANGPNYFQWFSSGGWDNVDGRTIWDPKELPDFNAERHEQDESLIMHQFEIRRTGPISVGGAFGLTRAANDLTERRISGKGEINCAEQRIYVWSMGDG